MADKLIFISCGQLTDAEKSVGVLIKALVDGTPGFKAYFAESVHDLDSLAHNVFDGIQRCAGAIVALRDRGLVLDANGAVWGHRSSVWVNQEVALLAYRQFAESTKLPILAFVDPGVKLEGAMTSLIVNPQPLPGLTDLKTIVDSWLANSDFTAVSADVLEKWNRLSDSARRVVAVLIEDGGQNVKESSVREALVRRFGIDANAAFQHVQESRLQFISTELVKLIPNTHSGPELSLNTVWEQQLRRECTKWLNSTR